MLQCMETVKSQNSRFRMSVDAENSAMTCGLAFNACKFSHGYNLQKNERAYKTEKKQKKGETLFRASPSYFSAV